MKFSQETVDNIYMTPITSPDFSVTAQRIAAAARRARSTNGQLPAILQWYLPRAVLRRSGEVLPDYRRAVAAELLLKFGSTADELQPIIGEIPGIANSEEETHQDYVALCLEHLVNSIRREVEASTLQNNRNAVLSNLCRLFGTLGIDHPSFDIYNLTNNKFVTASSKPKPQALFDFVESNDDVRITADEFFVKVTVCSTEKATARQYPAEQAIVYGKIGHFLPGDDTETHTTLSQVSYLIKELVENHFSKSSLTEAATNHSQRLEALLDLNQRLQINILGSEPTQLGVISQFMSIMTFLFPRMRSTSVSLYDTNHDSLVLAASLGIDLERTNVLQHPSGNDRAFTPFLTSPAPFSKAMATLKSRAAAIFAERLGIGTLPPDFTHRRDFMLIPFFNTKTDEPLGVASLSLEAGRFLDISQVETFKRLVGILQNTLTFSTFINELEWAIQHDGLTRLLNAKTTGEKLMEAFAEARRSGQPLSVGMLDGDRFKEINDTYGHHAGDRVLQQLAGILMQHAGEEDIVGRIGGEEFLVIWPGLDEAGSLAAAERIRTAVEKFSFSIGHGRVIPWTMSVGTATFQDGNFANPEMLRGAADHSLYISKGKELDVGGIIVHPTGTPRNRVTPYSTVLAALRQLQG